MIKIVEGNLLDAPEMIIGHQVNCQAVMGSGVAKQIKEKYPKAYEGYMMAFHDVIDNRQMLGYCGTVKCNNRRIVANLYGQLTYGRDRSVRYTDYNALETALYFLKSYAQYHAYDIALPFNIGCGLANGDWDGVVYPMLEKVFHDYNLTLYRYEG